jgi:3-oxoacyl-ACP reductase-like protein
VRPDSGAYTGALAALETTATAGKVDAMNRASQGAATAKQGALAAIPITATAKDHQHATRCNRTQHAQHITQGIVGVCVIHKNRERLSDLHSLHASRHTVK